MDGENLILVLVKSAVEVAHRYEQSEATVSGRKLPKPLAAALNNFNEGYLILKFWKRMQLRITFFKPQKFKTRRPGICFQAKKIE